MKSEITWLMGRFLGINPHTKKAVAIFIFLMRAVWFPVNIVVSAITINGCSAQPKLPPLMVSIAVFEPFVWCLLFYLYAYIPRKEQNNKMPILSKNWYWAVTVISATLALIVAALSMFQTVYMASLSKEEINKECSEDEPDCTQCSGVVWYGGWTGLAFKYLDVLRFVLCCVCYFNPRCRGNNQ